MNPSIAVKAVLLAGGLALSGAASAGSASAEMLSYTCAGCHGTNGMSNGPATPSIAGMSEVYFTDSMKAYKDGERVSTIMTRIAKGYSDEEVEKMAGFFSKQPFKKASQKSDAKMAAAGEKLHEKYCEKCHAEGGSSAEDDSGILAGQWTPYLKYSFKDFMDGKREMPKKMKKKVTKMHKAEGDAGIAKLLNYYGSQN